MCSLNIAFHDINMSDAFNAKKGLLHSVLKKHVWCIQLDNDTDMFQGRPTLL
jgi:hypothetical protein